MVIRGEGPSFSAGLDRRAFTPGGIPGEPGLVELAGLDPAALDEQIAAYQEGFTCWSGDGLISVAAVRGHAIGAGFQLVLACDLAIAADDAQFAMREPALGLVPDLGGTLPLVRAVGYPRALEICASGRFVEAREAAELGLVLAVVPVADLATAVDRLVAGIMAAPSGAVLATKALLRDAPGRAPADQLAAERAAQALRLRTLAEGTHHVP